MLSKGGCPRYRRGHPPRGTLALGHAAAQLALMILITLVLNPSPQHTYYPFILTSPPSFLFQSLPPCLLSSLFPLPSSQHFFQSTSPSPSLSLFLPSGTLCSIFTCLPISPTPTIPPLIYLLPVLMSLLPEDTTTAHPQLTLNENEKKIKSGK